MEDALESPILSTGQRAAPARLPFSKQLGGDAVAAVRVGLGLCPADNVGLAHRVLHRYSAMVRAVPANQLTALHCADCATAADKVRAGD